MQKSQISLCIRCGRERIFKKTWKEYLGTSLLTYTRTVCADAACQKIVDKQIALQKEKRQLRMRDKNRQSAKGKPFRSGLKLTN